jgi:hypothetical protein
MLRCSLRLPPGQPSPIVRSLLCYTLAGQRCDMLTITDFAASAAELSSREYVVITARVHPGETCASWVAQVSCSDAAHSIALLNIFVSVCGDMCNAGS